LKSRTIAEIACVVGAIIAVLQYAKIEPNVLDKIPKMYRAQVEAGLKSTEIIIAPEDYKESPYIYNLYRAAMAMDSGYSKDLQIKKVVDVAIRKVDFKIAISSANAIDRDHTKSMVLSNISQKALSTQGQSSYAVIAAELIPSSHSKSIAIRKILKFHEVRASGGTPGELSSMDKYKAVFFFADSSASMNLSEPEAKRFADKWFLTRGYEEFLLFKDVFNFADSTASMDMDEENSSKFAFKWLENYSSKEFYIFQDAFTFADSSAGMSMDEAEAEIFAFKKVHEHRESIKANKKINKDT
jgi:ribosomal protein S7